MCASLHQSINSDTSGFAHSPIMKLGSTYHFLNDSSTGGTPVVILEGWVGSDEKGFTSSSFMRDFDAATANSSRVIFRINSGGGSVFEGFAIFDQVMSRKKNITVEIYGLAASMASVLMLMADEGQLFIGENASAMIHRVAVMEFGNASELKVAADMCESLEKRMIALLSKRTGKPEEEVSKWFDGLNHWFVGQQAVDAGIADGIVQTSVNPNPPVITPDLNEVDVYNNFFNLSTEVPTMKVEHYVALGLPTNATEEQFQKFVNDYKALKSELDAAKLAQAKAIEDEAKALAAEAVKKGLIKPEFENTFVNTAKLDIVNVRAMVNGFEAPQNVTPGTSEPKASINTILRQQSAQSPQAAAAGVDLKTITYLNLVKNHADVLKTLSEEQIKEIKERSSTIV